MRRPSLIAAAMLALAGPPLLFAAVTTAHAQGWRDWDRDRGWRRWGGDNCRFVERRWVDDDGDVHIVRRRVCD